jgi:hypothetical protein
VTSKEKPVAVRKEYESKKERKVTRKVSASTAA